MQPLLLRSVVPYRADFADSVVELRLEATPLNWRLHFSSDIEDGLAEMVPMPIGSDWRAVVSAMQSSCWFAHWGEIDDLGMVWPDELYWQGEDSLTTRMIGLAFCSEQTADLSVWLGDIPDEQLASIIIKRRKRMSRAHVRELIRMKEGSGSRREPRYMGPPLEPP